MRCFILATAISGTIAGTLVAQTPRPVTATEYSRATRYLGFNTAPMVYSGAVRPNWLANDMFWYRNAAPGGSQFVLIDPAKKTRSTAFDHARLASALSVVAGTSYDSLTLPFVQFERAADDRRIMFDVGQRRFSCDVQAYQCALEPSTNRGGGRFGAARNSVVSPDGKRAAFIRDYNLWMRDVATGAETQLTTDGVKDFGYATDNAGWVKSDRAILLWSPDSKRIATFQQDERGVGEMYLVDTRVGHPRLEAWKYPLPGDSVITTIQRVVIDVDAPKVTRLKMPADQHRSTLCDHVTCRGADWTDVEWAPDASRLFFVSTSRDHKTAQLRVADPATGVVADILNETVATQYESGFGRANWHVLPASNEFIWFSERDNWGQLYLYDLRTHQLKNQITTGEGPVLQLLRVDEKTRTLYFTATGKEKGRDPYFGHLYSVRMDGKNLRLLTPEDANHEVSLAPDGRFFVDAYSRPDVPPVSVVRDADGKLVLNLEKADITQLTRSGWKPPIPITVKARDGVTDLYGLMFTPTLLDSNAKYPIVNHIYPGPQTGSVGGRSFSAARGDAQALAELGFVVVEIDAMGTPMRSKSFHDAYYGNMGDNGLPDQIVGMKQLSQRFRWIDIERTGIYGHSGGGFAAADAMFRYPEFFKVGISESGNHDNRLYEDDWGERYQGLLTRGGPSTTNYDDQANQNLARNLKGKLLLAHGTLDDNVPPYNTTVVVDALIKANKDFDLLMLPNQRHGYGNMSNYMMRRRWDYFVKNLLGVEPPKEFEIRPTPQPQRPIP